MVERLLINLPSQLQLIDRLQHLIYLSSSLIFVSGEKGTGKTVLIEQLSNQLPNTVQQAFVHLQEEHSDDQIRQQIITQLFEQPLFDAHDSLLSSFVQLQEKFSVDCPQLVIIDSAQYISNSLLAELAQLITLKEQLNKHELNVLLLASETSNEKQIATINQYLQASDSHCTCLEFKVEPFNNDEAIALLEHVFSQNGYQSQLQHQDAVANQLNACSGNPKKIIQLAEQIIDGKLDTTEISKFRARLPALLLMIALLFIATALAMYLQPQLIATLSPEKPPETLIESEVFIVEEIETTELVTGDISEAQATLESEPLAGSWPSSIDSNITESELKVGISDDTVPRVIISEQQISDSLSGGSELSVELQVNDTSQATATEATILANSPEQSDTTLATQDKVEVIPVPAIQETENIASDVQEKVIETVLTDGNEAPIEKNEALEAVVAEDVAKPQSVPIESIETLNKKSLFSESRQLLSIPASHFTLQLAAMDSKKSLQRFIRAHNLPQDNVYIYQTIFKNKPRYMIIYGDYKSRKIAQSVSKKLPGSLANIDIWIKQYRFVHQDLELNNE